jgi:bleomycin hydrolase
MFWDFFEKANIFLENAITTAKDSYNDRLIAEYYIRPINDRGHWNFFYNITAKYGLIPKDVMRESAYADNPSELVSIINERLRKAGVDIRSMIASGAKQKEIDADKIKVLNDIYRILAVCLGEPPKKFSWQYTQYNTSAKTRIDNYTPIKFYNEIVREDISPNNYILLANDPSRDYYKLYEVLNFRNCIEGINRRYVNVPIEDIKRAALNSLKDNKPLYAQYYWTNSIRSSDKVLDTKIYDYEKLFNVMLDMPRKDRIMTKQSHSTHAILLTAVDTDIDDTPIKWQMQNSWGISSHDNGYITCSDRWFEQNFFCLLVNRKYLSKRIISASKEIGIKLEIWDYMN